MSTALALIVLLVGYQGACEWGRLLNTALSEHTQLLRLLLWAAAAEGMGRFLGEESICK